jgi:hypothetical protein
VISLLQLRIWEKSIYPKDLKRSIRWDSRSNLFLRKKNSWAASSLQSPRQVSRMMTWLCLMSL